MQKISTHLGSVSENHMEEPDVDDEIDFDELEKQDSNPKAQLKDKVTIKLIVAEIAKSNKEKTVRKLLSPIMSNLDVSPAFGWFHSALVIGPWYIEWNASSLCIPRKCYSSAAFIAVDVDDYIKRVDIDEVIDQIAQVVLYWNIHKTYDQKKNNCQHFIDDICKAIGITLKFKGTMGIQIIVSYLL